MSGLASLSSAVDVRTRFEEHDYLADEGTSTAIFLALRLGLPLLLEGEPGVGKTTAAKVLAQTLDAPLIRLQCYEGLSASEALYDWNYQRQLLAIRLSESHHERLSEAELFSEEFLVERPILRCVRYDGPQPPVLLIDEVDRADDEFEALLLEVLGEGSVTVPELGTFTARQPPVVVLDLQPEPRPARRAAPPLPLPLAGVPGHRTGRRDPAPVRPTGRPEAHRVGHPVRRARPHARRRQDARHRGGHQLGRGPLRAGRDRARPRRRGGLPRRARQDARRPGDGRGCRRLLRVRLSR